MSGAYRGFDADAAWPWRRVLRKLEKVRGRRLAQCWIEVVFIDAKLSSLSTAQKIRGRAASEAAYAEARCERRRAGF